jgi:hypothetical protein
MIISLFTFLAKYFFCLFAFLTPWSPQSPLFQQLTPAPIVPLRTTEDEAQQPRPEKGRRNAVPRAIRCPTPPHRVDLGVGVGRRWESPSRGMASIAIHLLAEPGAELSPPCLILSHQGGLCLVLLVVFVPTPPRFPFPCTVPIPSPAPLLQRRAPALCARRPRRCISHAAVTAG